MLDEQQLRKKFKFFIIVTEELTILISSLFPSLFFFLRSFILSERIPISSTYKIILPSPTTATTTTMQPQQQLEIDDYDEDFDDGPVMPLQSQALASQRHMFRNGRQQSRQLQRHRYGSLTQTVAAQHNALAAREVEIQRQRRKQQQRQRRHSLQSNPPQQQQISNETQSTSSTTKTATTTTTLKTTTPTTATTTTTIGDVTQFFMRTGN